MVSTPQRERPLAGRLIGLSAGDAQDIEARGLLARHVDIVFGAIVGALAVRGARLAYGGDLRQRGFTEQLYEQVAEAYADDYLQGKAAQAPFVHYLATSVWTGSDRIALVRWLTSTAGMAELRFMMDDDYLGVVAAGENGFFIKADGFRKALPPEAVVAALQERPTGARDPATALRKMRKAMARDCDIRILLGGKIFDYSGDEPGIPAEARDSLVNGQAVLPLGGFGGATRDVAKSLQLLADDAEIATALPRDERYQKVMAEIGKQAPHVRELLGPQFPAARQLANTTHVNDVVDMLPKIIIGLPPR
jgi:hypothetical protein